MAVTSGTSANVSLRDDDADVTATKIVECTGWTMEKSAVDGAYASNNTGGYRRRVAGTKDVTGTISGVYDPATPIEAVLALGSRYFVQFHNTSTQGHKFYVRILGGPSYGGDIKDGNPAEWTCSWGIDDAAPTFNTVVVAPS